VLTVQAALNLRAADNDRENRVRVEANWFWTIAIFPDFNCPQWIEAV